MKIANGMDFVNDDLYNAKGATIFGLLTSTNAIVVVIGTPLITTLLANIIDVRKYLIGEMLIVMGLVSFSIFGRLITAINPSIVNICGTSFPVKTRNTGSSTTVTVRR